MLLKTLDDADNDCVGNSTVTGELTLKDINTNIVKLANKVSQVLKQMSDLTSMKDQFIEYKNNTTSEIDDIECRLKRAEETVDEQKSIITTQQRFLEELDSEKRELDIVIFGVDESRELDGASTDQDKCENVFGKAGMTDADFSCRRLGKSGERQKRPILVTFNVSSKSKRASVLKGASKLKDAGDEYKTIYVKTYQHPLIRKEWKRLRDAEKSERARPENETCNINLD